MPLKPGSSQAVISTNIRELHGGKTYNHTAEKFGKARANAQAVAIALGNARGRAFGGGLGVPPFQPQGMPTMPISPPQAAPAGIASAPPMLPPPQAWAGQPMSGMPLPAQASPMASTAMQGMPPQQPNAITPPNLPPQASPVAMNAVQGNQAPMGVAPAMPSLPPQAGVNGMAVPHLAMGGSTGVGGFNMAKEAHLRPSFIEGSEMRKLTRGPILSAVSGRTDAHKAMVPSGSYIVPADIVSGRGQGNTIAGANVLQRMFKLGPYSTGMPAMRMGHTMPRPMSAPRPMAMMASGGAATHDEHGNKLIPVDLAGGEVSIPPENLRAVVHQDIKIAHDIMDKWIVDERKKLRKTLAKLPGPAKD